MVRLEMGFGNDLFLEIHKSNISVPSFIKNKDYFDIIESNIENMGDETTNSSKENFTKEEMFMIKDIGQQSLLSSELNLRYWINKAKLKNKHNIFEVNEYVDEKLKEYGSGVLIPISITDELDLEKYYLVWIGFNKLAYCDFIALKECFEEE